MLNANDTSNGKNNIIGAMLPEDQCMFRRDIQLIFEDTVKSQDEEELYLDRELGYEPEEEPEEIPEEEPAEEFFEGPEEEAVEETGVKEYHSAGAGDAAYGSGAAVPDAGTPDGAPPEYVRPRWGDYREYEYESPQHEAAPSAKTSGRGIYEETYKGIEKSEEGFAPPSVRYGRTGTGEAAQHAGTEGGTAEGGITPPRVKPRAKNPEKETGVKEYRSAGAGDAAYGSGAAAPDAGTPDGAPPEYVRPRWGDYREYEYESPQHEAAPSAKTSGRGIYEEAYEGVEKSEEGFAPPSVRYGRTGTGEAAQHAGTEGGTAEGGITPPHAKAGAKNIKKKPAADTGIRTKEQAAGGNATASAKGLHPVTPGAQAASGVQAAQDPPAAAAPAGRRAAWGRYADFEYVGTGGGTEPGKKKARTVKKKEIIEKSEIPKPARPGTQAETEAAGDGAENGRPADEGQRASRGKAPAHARPAAGAQAGAAGMKTAAGMQGAPGRAAPSYRVRPGKGNIRGLARQNTGTIPGEGAPGAAPGSMPADTARARTAAKRVLRGRTGVGEGFRRHAGQDAGSMRTYGAGGGTEPTGAGGTQESGTPASSIRTEGAHGIRGHAGQKEGFRGRAGQDAGSMRTYGADGSTEPTGAGGTQESSTPASSIRTEGARGIRGHAGQEEGFRGRAGQDAGSMRTYGAGGGTDATDAGGGAPSRGAPAYRVRTGDKPDAIGIRDLPANRSVHALESEKAGIEGTGQTAERKLRNMEAERMGRGTPPGAADIRRVPSANSPAPPDVSGIIETDGNGITAAREPGSEGQGAIQGHLDRISESASSQYARNLREASPAEADGAGAGEGMRVGDSRSAGRADASKINTKNKTLFSKAFGRVNAGKMKSMKVVGAGAAAAAAAAAGGAGAAAAKAGTSGLKGAHVKPSGTLGKSTLRGGAKYKENITEPAKDNADNAREDERAGKNRRKDDEKSRKKKQTGDTKLRTKLTAIGMAMFLAIGATLAGNGTTYQYMSFDNRPRMALNAYSNKEEEQLSGDSMTQAAYATLKSRYAAMKNKIMYGDDYSYSFYSDGADDDPFAGECWQGTKYNLTEDQIRQITRVCVREQGMVPKGVAWEVCLAANLVELDMAGGGAYSPYKADPSGIGIYNLMRYGIWFGGAYGWGINTMDYGSDNFGGTVSDSPQMQAIVRNILCDGIRPLPIYVNEHDSFKEVASATNNGTEIGHNRALYQKDVTRIHQTGSVGGGHYTFYGFPDGPQGTTDPFGYTDSAYEKAKSQNMIHGSGTGSAGALADMSGSILTPDVFLTAVDKVCQMSRAGHFKYGNSVTMPPCEDGVISCDRMIARALYDLGFTDQPKGGIVCGNMRAWLKKHGWEETKNDCAAIKRGSILLVKSEGKSYWSHTFVVVDFDSVTWKMTSYDQGWQERIDGSLPQPETNRTWSYDRNEFIVFNIPDSGLTNAAYDGTENLPELNCIRATFKTAEGEVLELDVEDDNEEHQNSCVQKGVANLIHRRTMTGTIYGTNTYTVRTYTDSGNTYRLLENSVIGAGVVSVIETLRGAWDAVVDAFESFLPQTGGGPFPRTDTDLGDITLVENFEESAEENGDSGDYTEQTVTETYIVGYDTRDVEIEVSDPAITCEFSDRDHNTMYQHIKYAEGEKYTEDMFFRMLLSALTAGTDNYDSRQEAHVDNLGRQITRENYAYVGTPQEDRKSADATVITYTYTPDEDEEEDPLEDTEDADDGEETEEEKAARREDEYQRLIKSEYIEYACDLFDCTVVYGYDDPEYRTEKDNEIGSAGFYSVEYTEVKDENGSTSWTTDEGYTAIADEHYHIEAAVTFYVGSNPRELVKHSRAYAQAEWLGSRASQIDGYYILDDDTFRRYFNLHEVLMLEGSGGALPPVAKAIYLFLHNHGLSDVCIAGILGNMAAECGGQKLEGINPAAVESTGAGIGLLQWTGERRTALENYAASEGKQWSDLNVQLEFLWDELFVQKTGWTSPSDADRFKQCTTPRDAAVFFYTYCEVRSEDLAEKLWDEFAVETVRIPEAERAYQLMRSNNGGYATGNAIADAAIAICQDDNVGYHYGAAGRCDPNGGDTDCSGLVYRALCNAGIVTYPEYAEWSTQDGSMESGLIALGFTRVTEYNGSTCACLMPGDIIFKNGHVEVYIGNGQDAGAHSGTGTPAGDQSGEEVSICDWKSSLNIAYRYMGSL